MGAVKEIAIELEYHWNAGVHGSYWRLLPDGRIALILAKLHGGYELMIGGDTAPIWQGDDMIAAVAAAGALAQKQLQDQLHTWTV